MPHGTVIHTWLITESSAELASMCRNAGIDAEVKAKAESRRQEILSERLLLHGTLGSQVDLNHNDDHAPWLSNVGDLNISIAHTRGKLCVALNPMMAVGIDLEHIARAKRAHGVRTAFLNKSELVWLPEDDASAHLVAWLAKEAVFKVISVRAKVKNCRDEIVLRPFDVPAEGGEAIHGASFYDQRFALHTINDGTDMLTLAYEIHETK